LSVADTSVSNLLVRSPPLWSVSAERWSEAVEAGGRTGDIMSVARLEWIVSRLKDLKPGVLMRQAELSTTPILAG
jgi:hypothetical protein